MDHKEITMEQINPFVRYVHAITIGTDTPFVNVVPYDCRCVYILEGSGAISVGGRTHPARAGSLFLWPAGTAYSYLPLDGHPFSAMGVNFDYTTDRRHEAAPVPPARSSEFRRERLLAPVRFADNAAFNGALALPGMFWARDALQQMEREYRTRRSHSAAVLRGKMLCLLCDVARALQASGSPCGDVSGLLLDHIHAHFREPLTNEALSRAFSFHPAHLSRIIKRQTGMPLHRYLQNYRLSVAMNLLQTTRLSVSEVAVQSGFTDSNYFSRSFRRHWGRSPGAFRGG